MRPGAAPGLRGLRTEHPDLAAALREALLPGESQAAE